MEISPRAVREKSLLATPQESLALQTYRYFGGGYEREALLEGFKIGDLLELKLDYPALTSQTIDHHVINLDRLAYDEEDNLDATAEFRLAEAYFLKAAARLNKLPEAPQAMVDHFQEMNEQLYGAPDAELTAKMLQKVWQDILACRSPANASIIDKLKNGFVFTASNGEQLEIPALPSVGDDNETLPVLDEEVVRWLEGYLGKELAAVRQLFQDYLDQKSDEKIFTPADIASLFEQAAAKIGMEIEVIEESHGTNLSWSSSDRAVRVGMKRKPVVGTNDLVGLFAHEVCIHGQRSLNGARLRSEALENGLFTGADVEKGEDPGYLGFEEGLATVVQKTLSDRKNIWNIASMGNYLNIALASMGWTPRQVFEVMSRVRVVLNTSEEASEISPEVEEKAQKNALAQVVRIFRATPADKVYQTTDGKTLHYAKDLAYAAGKKKAVAFLNAMKGLPDETKAATWKKLLVGHYDPTNHYHRELVETCLTNN